MPKWILLLALVACGTNDAPTEIVPLDPGAQVDALGTVSGVVLETMDAAGYTYARLRTPAGEVWVAGPETPLAVGDAVTGTDATEMTGFTSRTLDRTFDTIFFLGGWGGRAASAPSAPGMPPGHPPVAGGHAAPPAAAPPVPVPDGVLRVTDVLATGASRAGEQVTVQGVVVKVNTGILGRNWIHLRPSATAAEDLLVTSAETAAVGDTVRATGTIATDQDFGGGYTYALLVEGAAIQPAR